jgi:putative membrane protein
VGAWLPVAGLGAAGIWAARRDLGRRGAIATALAAFGAGLVFDLASTRWGVPFGGYTYVAGTGGPHVSNVPLFTPVSYVFLGWIAIGTVRRVRAPLWTAPIAFMSIDLVVDPVTVRGREWFLGELFRYHSSGQYFGVPLSNFGGWLFLGTVITAAYAAARGREPDATWRSPAVVAGVLAFTVAVAASISAWALVGAGIGWALGIAALAWLSYRRSTALR